MASREAILDGARIVEVLGIIITAGLITGAALCWPLYHRLKKPKESDIGIAY